MSHTPKITRREREHRAWLRFACERWIAKTRHLPAADRAVFADVLALLADDDGHIPYDERAIAGRLALDIRTLRTSLARLLDCGLLRVETTKGERPVDVVFSPCLLRHIL